MFGEETPERSAIIRHETQHQRVQIPYNVWPESEKQPALVQFHSSSHRPSTQPNLYRGLHLAADG